MELSLKDFKELFFSNSDNTHFPVGSNVFIRTVTMAYTGKLVAVTDKELVLGEACWIADTGRFADFLQTGKISECEPFPEGSVIIGRGAIVDLCIWNHDLPRTQR